MNDELFKAMANSIVDGDTDEAARLAHRALESGIKPLDAVNKGYVVGVNQIGQDYSCGNAFLPELVMGGEAMKAAMEILEAAMKKAGTNREVRGRVVLGTIQGDIHEIGKSLVGVMLTISGFEVHDLGVDVPVTKFAEKAGEVNADIVAVSALLTTTMSHQRDVIKALEDTGLRARTRVMIGGAPVTRAWAAEIGADGYSEDAVGAVEVAKSLVAQRV